MEQECTADQRQPSTQEFHNQSCQGAGPLAMACCFRGVRLWIRQATAAIEQAQ
ncbi:hypothetical protein EV13_2474 [Prochlorococcus sp. MIT 0702]|nr:hypothetical protein EV12_2258 [Prochlorococcus sp. MIT 0701]KGG26342.1 hypothetical protein EV13_2474 [Prochlorococcus sp. MIT 0702]KGG31240.1 hypothetical protein EV14_2612 [Prochlorococcus sp. MIT 0703]